MDFFRNLPYFFITLPEEAYEKTIYVCVLHHLPYGTWGIHNKTRVIERVCVAHNGKLSNWFYKYGKGNNRFLLYFQHGFNNGLRRHIKAELDEIFSFKERHLRDAAESWDFIFSHSPIDEAKYIVGYDKQDDGTYTKEHVF